MRTLTALSLVLLAGPAALAAQDTTPLCYHARPKPACNAFVFTSFGAYMLVTHDDWGDAPFREVADWGAMVNVGQKDAVGASVMASVDRVGFILGPEVHYRRWLAAGASVEVAAGTSLVSSSGDVVSGSVLGLVRYSPNDWLALAARPDVLRWTSVTGCGPTGCTTATRPHWRLSLGLELGRAPGAVLSGLAAAATWFIASAIAAAND